MSDIVYYPATPVGVPSVITEPSASFKTEVKKVIGSIMLFFIVYVLLMALAVGLAVACVYAGIALIIAFPKFFTLMIGIGLIGLGVMVLFFLVKFIFAVTRFDHSNSVEISESEHPKLFAFIRQLAKDTQTSFPKRIYLSPEVNACVFYNSSFWSMLLPVRKNLQIGLGLVNSLTVSEFKAVMAHEFGHFSQRSMKLGSFVYNVNRVIYNMLYENNSYGRALQGWANISGYFAFFAGITARIVTVIQWVLQKMYGLVNKNYFGLSREMEFHADAIAASVSGSNNFISALHRLELADVSYSTVLDKCNELLKEKCILGNAYENHLVVLKKVAEENKLEIKDELPVVTTAFLRSNKQNRINFTNQWASHPSTEDRVKRLEAVNIKVENSAERAWILFEKAEKLQEQITTKLYYQVEIPAETITIGKHEFEQRYLNDIRFFSLPEQYKGFYDGRQISSIDIQVLLQKTNGAAHEKFHELFCDQNIILPKKITALTEEIQLLKAIADKTIDTKTFDFDGEKYDHTQAFALSKKLEDELKQHENALTKLDEHAFLFFYRHALDKDPAHATTLENAYAGYFAARKKAENFIRDANAMIDHLQPLYTSNLTIEYVNTIVGQLKDNHEPKFKDHLKQFASSGLFDNDQELKSTITKFIESDYSYFSGESFFNNELDDLTNTFNFTWRLINEDIFKRFKEVLDMQLEYFSN